MKTPYDTALRALQREVDEVRSAIGGAVQRLAEVESHRDAIVGAIGRESRLAAADWTFSPAPYLVRARAERARLAEAQRVADAELEALRHQAIDRYGRLHALEGAADTYRTQAAHAAAAAEQAGVDDVAGARFARALRLASQARSQARSGR